MTLKPGSHDSTGQSDARAAAVVKADRRGDDNVPVPAVALLVRDAEHERLAAEAEALAREQAALADDPDPAAFEDFLERLRCHMTALAAYVAGLPPKG
jgi:hypothetical protein